MLAVRKGFFERAEFKVLAARLATITGKFILSINGALETRSIFARFKMREVTTNYGIGSADRGGKVRELMAMNYALSD